MIGTGMRPVPAEYKPLPVHCFIILLTNKITYEKWKNNALVRNSTWRELVACRYSFEIDTWFICIISHYSQGSTLNFYPTCQFRQEVTIFPNFNFNCMIFYQNYFDKTFLPNSVINFSSIAFFFNDLKTSLNKKSLVQLDKRPSILTCPNFIFTDSRQVLMTSPDSVLSFCFHRFLLSILIIVSTFVPKLHSEW